MAAHFQYEVLGDCGDLNTFLLHFAVSAQNSSTFLPKQTKFESVWEDSISLQIQFLTTE